MSNTTQEFWDIDGVSLNQYCWNITTFGGSRYALPPKRGDNQKYPNRHGRAFRPKKMDSRLITLQMWAIGISQDDEYVSDQELQFNDNWQALRSLLFNLDDTMTLTRRWRQTINGIPTLVEASAECELASTMDLSMTGRTRGTFQVDLLLPDPLFYGEEITVNIEPGVHTEIFNPGDMAAYEKMSIRFDGELWAPRIRNLTKDPEVWVKANTLIQPSSYLDLDVTSFDAYRSYDNSVVTGAIQHAGAKPWFVLWPGLNEIKMESSGISSGSATLKFRPAYL
jgi:Phage tail protein